MPTSSKSRPKLLELPPDLNIGQLQTILNDRIRDLNKFFELYLIQPADDDVDGGLNRVVNIADPKNDLDGVNLRTLRKFGGTSLTTTTASGSSLDAEGIVFTEPGQPAIPSSGILRSCAYDVNDLRTGSMIVVSLSALTAPVLQALTVNPYIIGLTGVEQDLLSEPLILPIGQTAAVYSVKFAISTALTKGMKVVNRIIAGDAFDVTTTVVVKRS